MNSQTTTIETRLEIRQGFTLDTYLGSEDVISNRQRRGNDLDSVVIDQRR